MNFYLPLKKREILSFATTWVILEEILLSETNHTQKKKISQSYEKNL